MNEFDFSMPDVGEGLAEAEIIRWLVPEGGPVKRMEPMVEIETAKSVVEIPSPVDGVMVRHGAPETGTIEIGSTLAVLASAATPPAASGAPPISDTTVPETAVADLPAPSPPKRNRVPAAPTVRRMAVELGIDLTQIVGTGPAGRVLASDLRTINVGLDSSTASNLPAQANQSTELADRSETLSPMRTAIMGNLQRAWSQVPLITDMRDADAAGLVAARDSLAGELEGVKPTYTTLFAAVVIAALRRHPMFNASLDPKNGTVTHHRAIGLGVAVSVPGGLSVGVIHDAGTRDIRTLGQEIVHLAELARNNQLSPEQSRGATFTISSFGKYGGWYGTPLVVPPQVAIAGFGPIKDKVVPVNGAPAVRATLAMSISADHRLIDGAELSQFSSTIERLIADPIRILVG